MADCADTTFYLLQPFEHATVAGCTDCTLVVGAVAGLLHVVDCERTTITSASRRAVVTNSSDVLNCLFTPSPPLLVGDNRGAQFAPYNTHYDGLAEDLLATGLAAVLRSRDGGGGGGGSSVAGESAASPTRSGRGGGAGHSATSALQCASNKWKVPTELSRIEVPALPAPGSVGGGAGPASPGSAAGGPGPSSHDPPLSPGADEKASFGGANDSAVRAPVLLPPSEFEIVLVPVESDEARVRRLLLREAEAERRREGAAGDGDDDGVAGADGASSSASRSKSSGGTPPPPRPESDYCRALAEIISSSPFSMPSEYERRVVSKAERVRSIQAAMAELDGEARAALDEEIGRGFQDWLVTSGNMRQVLDLIHLEKRVGS